jgi:nucleotide-binding universal stress UspA family protein
MIAQRTESQPRGVRRIVVGVDGSAESKEALRWSLRLADMTGSAIDAVLAWQPPTSPGWAYPTDWNPADDAAKTLKLALAEALGGSMPSDIRPIVEEGNAVRVLLEHAKDAEMLVVGSRGLGGFMGLLLGSVSANCAERATCPVLVVHGGNRSSVASDL